MGGDSPRYVRTRTDLKGAKTEKYLLIIIVVIIMNNFVNGGGVAITKFIVWLWKPSEKNTS